ncbi:GAF domain-containing protein [Hymenobacter sp. BT523]|uniref:GAF domain-containing protein n=1 Tax=Hymenobacter sp. BT523 TaxID=2795725 RepID=UPI0018ECB43F|nr:GAF domain-containing protein [Hymenobacter sp. BT523]MBJ6107667.1 GAF domain-containing protein [Hymenobacter sp. BT523]
MSYSHLEPPNEQARLLIIQKYHVPTAFQEPIFQELTTLAAHIFGLPVAFLSLVDGAQVDFPATHGVPDLRVLPREAALCSMAVHQHTTVVLNDISQGSDSPHWQTAQRFRMEFYAGAPLLIEQQYAVGALCLSDNQSRAFTSQEEAVLNELAAVASQAITTRWQYVTEAEGAPHWPAVQQLAIQDIHLLRGLIHRLQDQSADAVLHVVQRRLANLRETVTGPSALLPLAISPVRLAPSS